MASAQPASSGRILVLCTGNICRSPYIEHLMRARLAGTGLGVASAGTGAVVGSAMHPESLRRLAAEGIDGADFRARQVTKELLAEADLVIGATREHVASIGWFAPEAMTRTHSLGDLAVALRHRSTSLPTGTGLAALVGAVDEHRRRQGLRSDPSGTDIVDPYQQPAAVWARMADQVDEHLPVVVSALTTAAGPRW